MAKDKLKSKNTKAITVKRREEDIRKTVRALATGYEPNYVLDNADKELSKLKSGDPFETNSNLFKAFTLYEFDKGILMSTVLPELYRSFAIEFSKNLQIEYNCSTPSEKSLAEAVAINYSRILEAQNRITRYIGMGTITDTGVRYLAVMSKELDRAERHYLSALQTLKMMKLPPFEVNIKTAVVGQNQIIQANTK